MGIVVILVGCGVLICSKVGGDKQAQRRRRTRKRKKLKKTTRAKQAGISYNTYPHIRSQYVFNSRDECIFMREIERARERERSRKPAKGQNSELIRIGVVFFQNKYT